MKKQDIKPNLVANELEMLKFWEDNQVFEKLKEQNKKTGKYFATMDGPITANGMTITLSSPNFSVLLRDESNACVRSTKTLDIKMPPYKIFVKAVKNNSIVLNVNCLRYYYIIFFDIFQPFI